MKILIIKWAIQDHRTKLKMASDEVRRYFIDQFEHRRVQKKSLGKVLILFGNYSKNLITGSSTYTYTYNTHAKR